MLQAVKQDYGGGRTEDNKFRVDRELDEFEELGLLPPTVRPGWPLFHETSLISAEKMTAQGIENAAFKVGSHCSHPYLCSEYHSLCTDLGCTTER